MYQLPAAVSIQFITGPKITQVFAFNQECITIGREQGNDISLDINDLTVSRKHIEIHFQHGSWLIKNISQTNIVIINQHTLQAQSETRINDQDKISIGSNNTFIFLIAPPQPTGQQQAIQRTMRAPQPGTPAASTPISIEISTNADPHKQKSVPLDQFNKPVIDIGRDPSNDIVIPENVISKFHFQIRRENNQLVLIHPHPTQPQTTNGLLYQGRHYKGSESFRHVLVRGDIFRIGNEYGTLVTLAYNDGSGVQQTVPALQPIALGQPRMTIGRDPQTNTIVLNHLQVSANHAELVQDRGTYRILDRNSTNHVYVNGRVVTNALLKIGDEIRIGPFKLTYDGTYLRQQDESKEGIRIDALHLTKVGKNQVKLLDDISLSIPPRKFVALVGGSGAGKSTLMDALNGLRPAHLGDVFYNGQDYYKAPASFSTQLGYVPQDDIVHRDLTVERALYYAAKLRLPEDFTSEKIAQRIDQVLEDVEMSDRRNLLIKDLSGGQRKRVSIALELLAQPSIFFLDEPTSGLDPGLDRKMMALLRKLADKGQTIVLVTHATNNIINNCDYVCFLCKNGRLAYFGPPTEAMTFFGQTDFADIYSALEPTKNDPDIPENERQRFKHSPYYQQYVEDPLQKRPAASTTMLQPLQGSKTPQRGSPLKQFFLLSMRYIELLKNDRGTLLILLLQAPAIGLILALLIKYLLGTDTFSTYRVSLNGINAEKTLFIMAFAAVMFGCINSAREIVKEAGIYRRERTVNLGIIPYLCSKFVVLGVLCLLQSAVLVLMVNFISPFHQGIFLPVLVEIYISMALTSLAGLTMGLAISALVPNNDRAMSFVPLLLIPQVIFSGIIFKLDGGAQFLGGFFAARWAMVAMGSSIGLHGQLVGADDFSFHGTLDGAYSQSEATRHLMLAWFVLVVMIVVLGFLTAYFLKRKDVRTR